MCGQSFCQPHEKATEMMVKEAPAASASVSCTINEMYSTKAKRTHILLSWKNDGLDCVIVNDGSTASRVLANQEEAAIRKRRRKKLKEEEKSRTTMKKNKAIVRSLIVSQNA